MTKQVSWMTVFKTILGGDAEEPIPEDTSATSEPTTQAEHLVRHLEVSKAVAQGEYSTEVGEFLRLFLDVGDIYYDLRPQPYDNQYAFWGELVDYWSDMLQGYGPLGGLFWEKFGQRLSQLNIPKLKLSARYLSGGWFLGAEGRKIAHLRRGSAVMGLYVSRQGEDLFISYRCFIQNPLLEVLLVAWVLACIPIAYMFANLAPFEDGVLVTTVVYTFGLFIFSLGWIASRNRGDAFAYFRRPLNNLYYDDVTALRSLVHQTILYAADQVGIDTTEIAPKQQQLQGWRSRF